MYMLPILIADIGQVIQVALVLLFILGPLLLRLFGASDRQPDRPQPRPRPQPSGPPAQGRPSAVDSEIDSFLRRAEAQRQDRPPLAVEVAPPERVKPARRPRPAAARAEERVIEADVVPAESITSRVRSSINTTDFAQRADQLGDRVEEADDAMEAHLQGAFHHNLGSLSKTPVAIAMAAVTPAPEKSAPADGESAVSPFAHLAARLRSPQGMRDAIVLREILERPEHRW